MQDNSKPENATPVLVQPVVRRIVCVRANAIVGQASDLLLTMALDKPDLLRARVIVETLQANLNRIKATLPPNDRTERPAHSGARQPETL